jgi:hypothetical protein
VKSYRYMCVLAELYDSSVRSVGREMETLTSGTASWCRLHGYTNDPRSRVPGGNEPRTTHVVKLAVYKHILVQQ